MRDFVSWTIWEAPVLCPSHSTASSVRVRWKAKGFNLRRGSRLRPIKDLRSVRLGPYVVINLYVPIQPRGGGGPLARCALP